jgi:hypothetical protein
MSEEKKGIHRLDTTSTNAMHWAECYYEHIEEKDADESDLMPWFANFWAAVNDPLAIRIEQLTRERDELADFVKRIHRGYNHETGVCDWASCQKLQAKHSGEEK